MYKRLLSFWDIRHLRALPLGLTVAGEERDCTDQRGAGRRDGEHGCSPTRLGCSRCRLGPRHRRRCRREGAEEERDRVRLQRRYRRRLNRAGLQPRRHPRFRRRSGRLRLAGDPAGQLRPDVPGRRLLLLHEQSRPRLWHQLLLGDEGDGPSPRLVCRLDNHHHRHRRDGQPGPNRGPLFLPPGRLGIGCRIDFRRDRRRRRLDRDHDRDRGDRDRALRPHPGRVARRRDLHPGIVRDRRPGQGLRRLSAERLGSPQPLLDQPLRAEPE